MFVFNRTGGLQFSGVVKIRVRIALSPLFMEIDSGLSAWLAPENAQVGTQAVRISKLLRHLWIVAAYS